ncbi:MAG: hypothetical protein KDA85_19835, partial [Planctomycetaceae bacterium]|nr:hypothetical protein [Planctomycetaceae bacterium]
MDSLAGFFAYDQLAHKPLQSMGIRVTDVPWRTPRIDWGRFELVVIRSPWDYQHSPQQFLATLEQIDQSSATLMNPLKLVRWNLTKTYLQDLQKQGVTIVPRRFLSGFVPDELSALQGALQSDQLVLKPVVGANADDTYRVSSATPTSELARLRSIFAERPIIAQPFVDSIVTDGEYSLIYLGNQFSHAIRKLPASGGQG